MGGGGEALGVSPLLEERLLLRWGSDSLLAFRPGWPEVGAVEEHSTLKVLKVGWRGDGLRKEYRPLHEISLINHGCFLRGAHLPQAWHFQARRASPVPSSCHSMSFIVSTSLQTWQIGLLTTPLVVGLAGSLKGLAPSPEPFFMAAASCSALAISSWA